MEDKWFFYLTFFLALFMTSISSGLVPIVSPLNRLGMTKAPSTVALVHVGLCNPALTHSGR